MQEKVNELKSLVGKKYQNFDNEGNFISCLEPMYLLYPELPRFKQVKTKDCFEFALARIQENLKEISEKDIQPLDIVVFHKFQRTLHIGIYIGNNNIIHCAIGKTYEIIRLSTHKELIKGYYRFEKI